MSFDNLLDCSIDYEPLTQAVSLIPCMHKFNEDPIRHLFEMHRQPPCPVCRTRAERYVTDHQFRALVEVASTVEERFAKATAEKTQKIASLELRIKTLEEQLNRDAMVLYKMGKNCIAEKIGLKNPEEGVKCLKAISDHYPQANLHLGRIFVEGAGIAHNQEEGLKYLQIAANEGLPKAQNYLGTILMRSKSYEAASELFEKSSNQGNPHAMLSLAVMYRDGLGVPRNLQRCFDLSKAAHEKGIEQADLGLAICYEFGFGTEKDIDKAVALYESAVKRNEGEAFFRLGEIFKFGVGRESNLKKAFEYYTQAAELQFPSSWMRCGECYEYGLGVDRDINQAVTWYLKALDNGNTFALEGIFNSLDQETLHDSIKEQSIIQIQEMANQKIPQACTIIGYLHAKKQNYDSAFRLFQEAAQLGDPYAQLNLGYCFLRGIGTEIDFKQAFQYFEKSYLQGVQEASYELGRSYLQGRGIERNKGKGFSLILESAQRDCLAAKEDLIDCFLYGIGTSTSTADAKEWALEASNEGGLKAAIFCGRAYEQGIHGFEINPELAIMHYQRAADKNYLPGNIHLKRLMT